MVVHLCPPLRVAGQSDVGKTCLVDRYLNGKYQDTISPVRRDHHSLAGRVPPTVLLTLLLLLLLLLHLGGERRLWGLPLGRRSST
jgi:hypothetical protein